MTRVLRLSQRTVDLGTGEVHGQGRLRPTELAMLAYLAERPGVTVPIAELHTEVWGYTPQVAGRSRAAYTTAARLRAVLEPTPAAPAHLLADRGEGYRLVDVAWESVDEAPPPPTNLGDPGTLFGRTDELRRLLENPARLWTVAGTGGAGKTRLALEVGWRSRPAGGVWFCGLEQAHTGAEIEAEVARCLPRHARGSVGERLRQLCDTLVILDNLEGPCGAELLGRWLAEAPDARFLVTRREPLGLGTEHVLRLRPLPLADGVALLRDRVAQRGRSDPGCLSTEEAATLWALVDGLPLSLEIVAANVALLGAETVVDRLRAGSDLPARRADAPERHRSLDQVLRWSWERLTPSEREAIATLAVIDGPFDLAAAEAALADPDAATRVADLVDASLLAVGPDQRFALLTTVRNAVRRWQPVDADAVLDRLLLEPLSLDASAEDSCDRKSPLAPTGLAQLVDRVARRTDLGPDRSARVRRVLVAAGAGEGAGVELLLSWLEPALSLPIGDPVRATVLADRALLWKQVGRTAEALDDCRTSAALARGCGATVDAWKADYTRGVLLTHELRIAEVEAVADALEREAGPRPEGVALGALGSAALLRVGICDVSDDDAGAERHSRTAIAAFRAGGYPEMASLIETNLLLALVRLGRLDEADALVRAAPPLPVSRGWDRELIHAEILSRQGASGEAVASVRRVIGRRQRTFHLGSYASGLLLGARVLLQAGEDEDAAACLRSLVRLPPIGPYGPTRRAWSRAVLALLAEGPAAAAPHALEAQELATSRGLSVAITEAATLQAELRWALGDPLGAACALEDALHGRRLDVLVPAALLLAETRLRLGDPERARDLAIRGLRAGAAVERARAHALLATTAAIDGAWDEARGHLRHTTGVRGPGQGWIELHRAWCGALRTGRPPDPVRPSSSALDLALRACAVELGGDPPAWIVRQGSGSHSVPQEKVASRP